MSVTILLIILISLVSYFAWQKPALQQKLLFHPYSVKHRNEYFRFITGGFVHSGWLHLFFNMFTFYFFGNVLEVVFGRMFGTEGFAYLVSLLIFGIIVSDIPTYFKYKDAPHYRAVGASGGVSAVVFCSIMFFPTNDLCLYGIICIPGFILGPLFLIYSYYQGKRMADNINHDAHFYGALFGVAFSFFVDPQVMGRFIEQVAGYQFQF
jgi:membrane associated rhomboid family serine protease